jgi:hypothetical protein
MVQPLVKISRRYINVKEGLEVPNEQDEICYNDDA